MFGGLTGAELTSIGSALWILIQASAAGAFGSTVAPASVAGVSASIAPVHKPGGSGAAALSSSRRNARVRLAAMLGEREILVPGNMRGVGGVHADRSAAVGLEAEADGGV